MEYRLRDPERVALEFDGDKTKIAGAVQEGVIDLATAVLAGMYIDKMRAAATAKKTSPTTVAEEVLPMPNKAAGLSGAALTDDVFNFAPGGIVPATKPRSSGLTGLEAAAQQFANIYANVPKGLGSAAYQEYLQAMPAAAEKRRQEDLWSALAQFGFNLAGSQSPNFLQAAGQAGMQTIPAIQEAIKVNRISEENALRAQAELDRQNREDQLRAIDSGVGFYSKQLDRDASLAAQRMAINKPTDMRSYVADYVQATRASGDNTTPEAVLRRTAAENYLGTAGASGVRAQIAADVAQSNAAEKAKSRVDAQLSAFNSPQNRRYLQLQRQDLQNRKQGNPTNLAEEYVNNLYDMATNGTTEAIPAARKVYAVNEQAIAELKRNPTADNKRKFDYYFGDGKADEVLRK